MSDGPLRSLFGCTAPGGVSFGLRRSWDDVSVGMAVSESLRPGEHLDAGGNRSCGGPQRKAVLGYADGARQLAEARCSLPELRRRLPPCCCCRRRLAASAPGGGPLPGSRTGGGGGCFRGPESWAEGRGYGGRTRHARAGRVRSRWGVLICIYILTVCCIYPMFGSARYPVVGQCPR